MERFIICVRKVKANQFIAEPGKTRFLIVPAGQAAHPNHEISPDTWLRRLRKACVWSADARVSSRERGDILIYVHGYNNAQQDVLDRHDQLLGELKQHGYKGAMVTFDWPSEDMAINYLEDRHDAKHTAMQLVTDGIRLLSEKQTPDCAINIHLLGHSTGAYLIREAFDDADDSRLPNNA